MGRGTPRYLVCTPGNVDRFVDGHGISSLFALFHGHGFQPLLVAFLDGLVVVGDLARTTQRLGLLRTLGLNVVRGADDKLFQGLDSILA